MPVTPTLLIGPMAARKSTVAEALAKLTGIRNVPMDKVRWYYYLNEGYSLEKDKSLASFTEKMAYWKPFEVIAVKRIIAEFPDAIIDFGAGHSYFTDPTQFSAVKTALAPLPNIFLLLPCENKKRALEICNQRLLLRKKAPLHPSEIDSNRNFIEHESNYRLAKHVIYTEDQSPDEVAEKVRSLLR